MKYWKPAIIPITSEKKMTGEINGSVTCQNRWRPLAPSMSAAS